MLNPIETNTSFKNGVQFAWDGTSVTLVQTCLRKYFYKIIQGWTPFDKSPHLLLGGWYATALEHYYKHKAAGYSHDEAQYLVVEEALESTWVRKDKDGNEVSYPWMSSDPLKSRENLIRTIVWYLEEFKEDTMEVVILPDGKPAVEYSFTIEFEKDILYCGHLDRLVNYNGDYYIQDQKTTKTTIGSYYFEQFNPDVQMSGYTYAGQIMFKLPIKGVVIDAVQIAVGFSRFTRGFTSRTNEQLEEWKESTVYWIRLAQEATRKNFFPMNTTSCSDYGGCEFRTVCQKNEAVRQQFLKAKFHQQPSWSPLDRR